MGAETPAELIAWNASMPLPEFVARYTNTTIDFWRLKPAQFIAAIGREPDRYLGPYQFLAGFLGIEFLLCTALFTLGQADPLSVSQHTDSMAQAWATRQVAFAAVGVALNALVFRAVSQVWPVKGGADFRSIFAFQCYMCAVILPTAILDFVGQPVTVLVAGGSLPEWSVGIPPLLILAIAALGLVFRNFPGIAHINHVSTSRLLVGFAFWPAVVGTILGLASAIVWEVSQ